MGLFDRITRVVRANLNDLVSKAEEPEKVLEQSVADMQEDIIKLRQAVAQAIASQKRTEQQYNTNLTEANKWQQRAQLALTKGDETLAREALTRKKTYSETAESLQQQLKLQSTSVDTLKRQLRALESKISEAKTKKDMLKARASAAKAQQQLQSTISSMNTGSAMAAFDRMEDKVMQLEAQSQASFEIGGNEIENQFAALESSGDIDAELLALKAGIQNNNPPLPASSSTYSLPAASAPQDSVVDAELEELRRQLKNS